MSAAASVKARKDRVQLNSYCELLNSQLEKAFDGSELDAAMEQADKTMVTGRAHAAALAAGKTEFTEPKHGAQGRGRARRHSGLSSEGLAVSGQLQDRTQSLLQKKRCRRSVEIEGLAPTGARELGEVPALADFCSLAGANDEPAFNLVRAPV